MACPTCDHTMHGIGNGNFWCPRCGTLVNEGIFPPKLVDRCRRFGATLGPAWGQMWIGVGIEESIFTPDKRRDVGAETIESGYP